MASLFPILLFLHLVGVMVGLGPTFVFSRIVATAAKEPAHARFASKLVQSISKEWSHPLAGLVFVTGVGMILVVGYDLTATLWLLVSIALFLPSYFFAALVQNRDIGRILQLTENGPVDPATPDGQEVARRRLRVKRGGIYLRLTALLILFLMVVKPF